MVPVMPVELADKGKDDLIRIGLATLDSQRLFEDLAQPPG